MPSNPNAAYMWDIIVRDANYTIIDTIDLRCVESVRISDANTPEDGTCLIRTVGGRAIVLDGSEARKLRARWIDIKKRSF